MDWKVLFNFGVGSSAHFPNNGATHRLPNPGLMEKGSQESFVSCDLFMTGHLHKWLSHCGKCQ